MAGWGVAVVSREHLIRVVCGPVVCDTGLLAFLGVSNNTAELTGLAEAIRWDDFFIPRVARLRTPFDSKHAARVTLGVAHAKNNIALACTWNTLLLHLECKFHFSANHVFSHAGNAGNECADVAASLGIRAWRASSPRTTFLFLGLREFFVQRLFEIPHRLTQIAEVLHTIVVQSEPGHFSPPAVFCGILPAPRTASPDARTRTFFSCEHHSASSAHFQCGHTQGKMSRASFTVFHIHLVPWCLC